MILSSRNMMALGEQIEESRGKITGRRVLNVEGILKMETLLRWRETIEEHHAQTLGPTRPC